MFVMMGGNTNFIFGVQICGSKTYDQMGWSSSYVRQYKYP